MPLPRVLWALPGVFIEPGRKQAVAVARCLTIEELDGLLESINGVAYGLHYTADGAFKPRGATALHKNLRGDVALATRTPLREERVHELH